MTHPLHLVFTLVGALLFLATLPLTLELLILSAAAALPPRKRRDRQPSVFRLAVVIPAHNEEKLIATCVQSLLADRETPTELFVVAHNCTDRTAELAAAAGARVLPLDGPGGKGNALDHGFRHALSLGTDAVLVIDADSIVSPNLLRTVARAIRSGAAAVQTRYQVANADTNLRTRLAALALLGMNVLRPRGRSRLGLSCGIFGNGFALAASTLQRVPYTANSLVEDLEYHLRLVQAGIRVEFLDRAAVFGEMPENAPAAATQRARWEGGRALMRRQWTRPLLRATLHGHKRMLEPLLDLLALPLATQAMLLVVGELIPLPWLRLYSSVCLLLIAFYVAVAASLSNDPADALRALAAAPGYLVWKLLMIPRTRLASRKDAAWIRTRRNAEKDSV
jgi:cellulose synthase/poly-beta-1,6-N-acetylglucosamine synthase-like glycosyltransferase